MLTIEQFARIWHEAHRALDSVQGRWTPLPWETMAVWQHGKVQQDACAALGGDLGVGGVTDPVILALRRGLCEALGPLVVIEPQRDVATEVATEE